MNKCMMGIKAIISVRSPVRVMEKLLCPTFKLKYSKFLKENQKFSSGHPCQVYISWLAVSRLDYQGRQEGIVMEFEVLDNLF